MPLDCPLICPQHTDFALVSATVWSAFATFYDDDDGFTSHIASHLGMCVCVCVCVCACVCVCLVRLSLDYICAYACMYACMHVCMNACMHVVRIEFVAAVLEGIYLAASPGLGSLVQGALCECREKWHLAR